MSEQSIAQKIPLGKSGQFAIVDDEDFELVSQFKWRLSKHKRSSYAECGMFMGRLGGRKYGKKQGCSMLLHQLIMRPPKGMEIDHRDHNGLNCRRENLRICTRKQNRQNSYSHQNTSSLFKGVSWNKLARKWRAYIYNQSKECHLGYFASETEAARAYDRAALKYFGEFACTNFPRESYAV